MTDELTARTSWRWGVAAFLLLVLVVALVVVVLEVLVLRPRYDRVRADQDTSAAVVRAAEQFTVQFNTYDSTDIAGYKKSVDSMMSPKFQTDYSQAIDQFASTLRQAKVSSKGVVLASAVASVDTDSAQVLVVSDASVKNAKQDLARHFRWQVSLVKINGSWLVDDFNPVT